MKQSEYLRDLENSIWSRFGGQKIDRQFVHTSVIEAYDDFILYHADVQDDSRQLMAYVRKASTNKILNEIKRLMHLSSLDGVDMTSTVNETDALDARADLNEILRMLTPKQAEIYRCKEVEGLTISEISTKLSMKSDLVKYHLKEARRKINNISKK